MVGWKVAVAALVGVLSPLEAGAAPAGKVVIAQGVDPTTLDMANQPESPASNVQGRHHIRLRDVSEQHGVRPQGGTDLADRLGHGHDGRRDRLWPALQ